MSQDEEGIYDPLPGENYIRYLILEPGDDEEPLRCHLQTANLDDPPAYEAISYVWGSPERTEPLKCGDGGRTLLITPNLARALRRLRPSRTGTGAASPRALWADSVCIDQHCAAERGAQVLAMRRIYGEAVRVLAVLGSETAGHAPGAAALVEEVSRMVVERCQERAFGLDEFPFLPEGDPLRSDRRWRSVLRLTDDPWFTRGWVIQEVYFAKEALFLWGDAEIEFMSLMRLLTWSIKRGAPRYNSILRSSGVSVHLYAAFVQRQPEARALGARVNVTGFANTLNDARDLQLTDLRDRIYAFLSFAQMEGPGLDLPKPDYTKPPHELYTDYAREYLFPVEGIGVLHYCQHYERSLELGIPSWVPQWDQPLPWHPASFPRTPILLPVVTPAPQLRFDSKSILRARGFTFDMVELLSEEFRSATTLVQVAHIYERFVMRRPRSPYPYSTRPIAFVQALEADFNIYEEFGPWQSHVSAFLLDILSLAGQSHDFLKGVDKIRKDALQGRGSYCWKSLASILIFRRFFVSERGYFGLAPPATKPGDICAVLPGCRSPFILRLHDPSEKHYKVVGDASMVGKISLTEPDYLTRTFQDFTTSICIDTGLEEKDILLV